MSKTDGAKRWLALSGGAFLVLVLASLAASALLMLVAPKPPVRSGHYAVFLTNGQAYFGNITAEDQDRLVLKNIFYIQKNPSESQSAGDVTLLKLGNELHGPEDMMEINKDHILFIELLKPDGKVAKAIQEYKK
jgi:hypothetical protein